MARVSNTLFIIVNFITLILGLAAVIYSVFIRLHGGTTCQKILQEPLLVIGVFASVVSYLGLMGPCCRVNAAMMAYLVFVAVLILGIIAFTIFGLLVTKASAANNVQWGGFREHRIKNYSGWLRRRVLNYRHWAEIGGCLADFHICNGYRFNAADSGKPSSHFSRLQSGCCKPPVYCGYKYKNGTFWEMPRSGPAEPDLDCRRWSNNPRRMCYYCNSCIRGMVHYIRLQWLALAVTNISILILVVVIANIAFCVRRNIRADLKFLRYNQPYNHHTNL
ncbi:hypothetical protein SLA2020_481920 [Shorea laevis]